MGEPLPKTIKIMFFNLFRTKMDVRNGSGTPFCSGLRLPGIQKLQNQKILMIVWGSGWDFLDAGGHILIYFGRSLQTTVCGPHGVCWGGEGRRLPHQTPKPPPNCYLWGAPPLKLPIFYYTVIFGHPKKTRNEKMYIEMVKCCLHLWRWIDSWPKRCLRFGHNYVPSTVVPSTWYQTRGTKHYNIRSSNV